MMPFIPCVNSVKVPNRVSSGRFSFFLGFFVGRLAMARYLPIPARTLANNAGFVHPVTIRVYRRLLDRLLRVKLARRLSGVQGQLQDWARIVMEVADRLCRLQNASGLSPGRDPCAPSDIAN